MSHTSSPLFSMFFLIYFPFLSLCLFLTFKFECNGYIFSVLTMSLSFDSYSTAFFFLLGIVSSSVFMWAYYYLDVEVNYARFFMLLCSFIMSMVMLIFFSNLFMTLIGWDGLGVTSFLLVIYYKNRSSLGSGMITAMTNRIGDALLLCSLAFYTSGSQIITLALIISLSMTKSAQLPFSSWLPAAMAAPTPVSALVHSSTLVTAGVYVLLRYCSYDQNMLFYIGSCTLLVSGLSACAESDLKKVIALSTLSQLGIMFVSLGAHEKSFCFFHLMTHACFKALMFLCVGICLHTIYGTQDYRSFNKMPKIVSLFWSVSVLSLMGFVFTSGFYSKDMILEELYSDGMGMPLLFFVVGIGLTTMYSMKMLTSTVLTNSFTGPVVLSVGGFGWPVKISLIMLSLGSVVNGLLSSGFCGLHTVVLNKSIMLLPSVTILAGAMLSYTLLTWCNPMYSSMMWLVPSAQVLSSWTNVWSLPQKNIDKGWIEGLSKLSPMTFTPLISLGLSTSLLMQFI